ncbi:MAG TPA: M35 family metallo-endopeptidase [Kineosporiaceae bacterium]|nr:M35 family metallo-endopeptidase [Kineosporiaceae bacterium]
MPDWVGEVTLQARRRRHRTDEPRPRRASPPDRDAGGVPAAVLALQRRAGNRAVKALLEHRIEVAPPPDGPTATTVVAGRPMHDDGRGDPPASEPGPTARVATIVGEGMVRHADAPQPGADVTYDRDKPAIKGHAFDEQLGMILSAVGRGRRMLDAGFKAVLGVDTLQTSVIDALADNFHNVDRSSSPTRIRYLDIIQESLAKTRRAFDDDLPIEIETEDTSAYAYVNSYWIIGPSGPIHLNPAWFERPAPLRAKTVVHEACHRYDNDDDHAYKWDTAAWRAMSAKEAVDNADSYAMFCLEVS